MHSALLPPSPQRHVVPSSPTSPSRRCCPAIASDAYASRPPRLKSRSAHACTQTRRPACVTNTGLGCALRWDDPCSYRATPVRVAPPGVVSVPAPRFPRASYQAPSGAPALVVAPLWSTSRASPTSSPGTSAAAATVARRLATHALPVLLPSSAPPDGRAGGTRLGPSRSARTPPCAAAASPSRSSPPPRCHSFCSARRSHSPPPARMHANLTRASIFFSHGRPFGLRFRGGAHLTLASRASGAARRPLRRRRRPIRAFAARPAVPSLYFTY